MSRRSRFRQSDALRRVVEAAVSMCIAAGLVGGEAFSVDASLIEADVDKKKRVPCRSEMVLLRVSRALARSRRGLPMPVDRLSQRRERARAAARHLYAGAGAVLHELPGVVLEVDGRSALTRRAQAPPHSRSDL